MEVHIFLLVPAGVLLQELTGDDLVREDKCGVSTYYWSFPGEAGAKKSDEVKQLREGNTNVQLLHLVALLGTRFAREGPVAVSYTHLTLPTICSV